MEELGPELGRDGAKRGKEGEEWEVGVRGGGVAAAFISSPLVSPCPAPWGSVFKINISDS